MNLDGLSKFDDIGSDGYQINLEFSFDGGKNYIAKNCGCSLCKCNDSFDIDIQRIRSLEFISDNKTVDTLIYDKNSKFLYLPKLRIKENGFRPVMKKMISLN